MNYSIGFQGGFMPSYGGKLKSYVQEDFFQSKSGIDGINRSMNGYDTNHINRLFATFGGVDIKTTIYDYYVATVSYIYYQTIYGGKGKTVFTTDNTNYYLLECEYTYKAFDIPVTLGLCIPFWKDIKISLNCGIVFANVEYKNKFKSDTYTDPFERKGEFKGWVFPVVMLVQGEYIVSSNISLTSSLSYYHGSTGLLTDNYKNDTAGLGGNGAVDFAAINHTGYRFSFGILYYIYSL